MKDEPNFGSQVKNWIIDRFAGKRAFQSVFDKLMKLSLAGMNYGRASRYQDNGEWEALKTIAGWMPNVPLTLFDVGAHVGEYSKLLLKAFEGRHKIIYTFEPSKQSFDRLSIELTGHPEIILTNAGLSDVPGEVQLFSHEPGSTLSSVYPRVNNSIKFQAKETARMICLDAFCREREIGGIHFLKLDVEGHELAVLRGSKHMLQANLIDVIQFEFGGCNIDSRTYFRDFYELLSPKFQIFRVLRTGLFPLAGYNERLEVFQSSNFVARRR